MTQKVIKPWITTLCLNEKDGSELMTRDQLTEKHTDAVNAPLGKQHQTPMQAGLQDPERLICS